MLHEGIATDVLGPDPQAQLTLPNGRVLKAGDPVVTYVARNLDHDAETKAKGKT